EPDPTELGVTVRLDLIEQQHAAHAVEGAGVAAQPADPVAVAVGRGDDIAARFGVDDAKGADGGDGKLERSSNLLLGGGVAAEEHGMEDDVEHRADVAFAPVGGGGVP